MSNVNMFTSGALVKKFRFLDEVMSDVYFWGASLKV